MVGAALDLSGPAKAGVIIAWLVAAAFTGAIALYYLRDLLSKRMMSFRSVTKTPWRYVGAILVRGAAVFVFGLLFLVFAVWFPILTLIS